MPMKLFYSPFHSFVHKVLVTAHEAGLWSNIVFVPSFPFRNLEGKTVRPAYDLSPIAPLGKVPCLALEDGTVLYGSQVVAEYLDDRGRRGLFPLDGHVRWDALRRLALGDAIFELSVQLGMEGWLPAAERRIALYEWLWPKIVAALDALESAADRARPFDIGDAAALQGISYLAAKSINSAEDPVNPNYDWRKGRKKLAALYDEALDRPSVRSHFRKDYSGDMSPEFHRAMIDEVLAAQRAARARA